MKKRESIIAEQNRTLCDSSRYLHIFLSFLDTFTLFLNQKHYTVSLYKLEDKQKPRTKLSMYPINIHIGEPKTAFT